MFGCEDSPEAPTASGNCALGTIDTGALTAPITGPDLPITELGGPTTVLDDKVCISEEELLRGLAFDPFTWMGLWTFPDCVEGRCSEAWGEDDFGVIKLLSELDSAPCEAIEEGGRWDLWEEEDWTEDACDPGDTLDDDEDGTDLKAVDNSCLDDGNPSRREVWACCFVWTLLSGLTEPTDSCLDEADFSCLEEDFEDEDAEVDDADLARTFWTLLGTFPAEGDLQYS